MLKKKSSKLATGILSFAIMFGAVGATASAASWTDNLSRWSGAVETSTVKKTGNTKNYYMKVNYVGGQYDSVQHWIESNLGANYSKHYITKEGSSNSPASTATLGKSVTLNIKNPINTSVRVEASGNWSPN